jgi:hypothetical protein
MMEISDPEPRALDPKPAPAFAATYPTVSPQAPTTLGWR